MPEIAILPYGEPRRRGRRLAEVDAAVADWPLGCDAQPPSSVRTLGDLTEADHLVMYVNSRSLLADLRGLRCRVSALLFEPPVMHGRYYRLLEWLGGRYHRVLTHNNRLLARLPNARFLPHGGCWLASGPVDRPDHPKSASVSLIASKKRDAPGHKLRHRIAAWAAGGGADIDLFGRAYTPLEDKAEGHSPYRYSVVIENSREPGYFTEKVLDSLLCLSVPIYWGAPDIAHFLDPRGLLVCHTEAELRAAVLAASVEDYATRLPYLEANRQRALRYADRLRNAAELLANEDAFGVSAAA